MIETEIQRRRWRRHRQRNHLVDTSSDDFATGGLAGYVENVSVRFLVLPNDPEADVLSFDDEFWEWFLQERANPFGGSVTEWGHYHRPSADAAIRHDRQNGMGDWDRYLALYRSGGFEFGLGRVGGFQYDERRMFRLIEIVGRIWWSLHFYPEAVGRFHLEGPWECGLALRHTRDADLANLGEGWTEPGTFGGRTAPRCQETHLLLRKEIETWPQGDAVRDLAFAFGDWIEDAWGMRKRRYLAQRGDRKGEFDFARYGQW